MFLPSIGRILTCAVFVAAFWLAAPAFAGDDFERGFKNELGRIGAHHAVHVGKRAVFQHAGYLGRYYRPRQNYGHSRSYQTYGRGYRSGYQSYQRGYRDGRDHRYRDNAQRYRRHERKSHGRHHRGCNDRGHSHGHGGYGYRR